jgi:flagellar motor switch protein FliN/FliY
MSDDDQTDDNQPDESADVDADALANEVAGGVEEASSEDQAVADEWAAAMEEAGETGEEEEEVQPAPMEELEDDSVPADTPEGENMAPELDVILDIPVMISMEVGNTKIAIRNLLQLNQGSVIELDRLAGEPLDVLVNGTLIAHGEVVMVNDKFGIRLTDVISQSERIQRLK